jgi:hypothetical protein
MTSESPLEHLAGPGGVLSKEPPDASEFAGLVESGLGLRDEARALDSLHRPPTWLRGTASSMCRVDLSTVRQRIHRPGGPLSETTSVATVSRVGIEQIRIGTALDAAVVFVAHDAAAGLD